MNINIKDFSLLVLFVVIGVLTRTILHIAPNVEFVTGVSLAAGYFFTNKKLALFVPLLILLLTDLIIGNTLIYLFTWSGFLITPLICLAFTKLPERFSLKLAVKSEVMGVLSTLIFFFWTNFGVVLTTDMYSKDLQGLVQSYINALPFLRNQLLGNMIIVPLVFTATAICLKVIWQQKNNKAISNDAKKIL